LNTLLKRDLCATTIGTLAHETCAMRVEALQKNVLLT